jgi:hypothetical protein
MDSPINNKFVTNRSESGGSAIHNRSAGVNLFIVQNVFENNNSELDQAGIYADQSGYGGDHPFVFASNLIRNSPLMLGYMNTKNFIHNNIFVDNEKDIISEIDQTVLFIYNNFLDISKLPDALIRESENIFNGINLGFKDYANSDFKLTSDSGLIDVGTTNSEYPYDDVYFPTEDYTGLTARLSGASIDLGPYEYSATTAGSLDIDGNGQYDALTDGLLLLRGMFLLSGDSLVSDAVASDAVYKTSGEVASRIDMLGDLVDIDGNGTVDALTDGLVILRYLFNLRGDVLINDVIASDATVKTAEDVEAKIEQLIPAL